MFFYVCEIYFNVYCYYEYGLKFFLLYFCVNIFYVVIVRITIGNLQNLPLKILVKKVRYDGQIQYCVIVFFYGTNRIFDNKNY